ncbi:MAG TPA: hypothetical protein VHF26_10300 [Trebonia sp.]|nr:hypothetical protein [Trebonia sp.]
MKITSCVPVVGVGVGVGAIARHGAVVAVTNGTRIGIGHRNIRYLSDQGAFR